MFFKEKGQEERPLKSWVVVCFHILIPVILGIWGLLLSIAANSNKDQINTLTNVVQELKNQNSRLQTLVMLLNNQLQANINEIKLSNRPVLKADSWSGDNTLITIRLTNSGGELSDLAIKTFNGVTVDPSTLPNSKSITPGSEYYITFKNLKSGRFARLTYKDVLLNRFSQELFYDSTNDRFQFGTINEIYPTSK